jgi:hypothetical protein
VNISVNQNNNLFIQNDKKIKSQTIYIHPSAGVNYDLENIMTVGYRGSLNYSVGWTDVAEIKTIRNLSHSHNLNLNVYLPKKFEWGTECGFNFQPKNSSFNNSLNTIIWNAFVEKKFFKNEKALIKFSVNDILNNNTGYSRSVSRGNTSESERLVIKRYWLLTLTWNFLKSTQ